jgi:hypothetical protein
VNDQQQYDTGMSEDGTDLYMPEAPAYAVFQFQVFEQPLENYQAGKRGHLLIFETKYR